MSDLLRAADVLDQLADALPEYLPPPWRADGPSGSTLCAADGTVLPPTREVAQHVAATASPDRVRAQAALLRAVAEMRAEMAPYDTKTLAALEVEQAAHNLARHYTTGSQT